MQYLNGVYATIYNEVMGRTGHLFERPYRNIPIDEERHALEVARYVVLNPVRAGLARRVSGWPWSSYRATAGLLSTPPWLTTTWIQGLFDENPDRASVRYAQFVGEGAGAPRPPALSGRGKSLPAMAAL